MVKSNKQDYSSTGDDTLKAVKSTYENLSSDLSSEYPEIKEIREDINALKDNVFELGRHVKKNSGKHVEEAKHFAERQLDYARKVGSEALHKVEDRVAEKPGQTIVLAFFAGLAASFLLGRKA